MTEIHAGYRVPSEELDEIPMDNHSSRVVRSSRPAGEYQRRSNAESCWCFVIRHRLAVVVAVLLTAILIVFVAFATHMAIAPGTNYTKVEIDEKTEVKYSATERAMVYNELEDNMGDRVPLYSIQDEPLDDMLGTLLINTRKSLPIITYQIGKTERMKREVEETSVESCRKRHENCRALLNRVKKMTRNVSQQVHQLQRMINRLGILNEELPSLGNVTVLDVANCLRCERIENQTAGLNLSNFSNSTPQNYSTQSEAGNAQIYDEDNTEISNNQTEPLIGPVSRIASVEEILPPEIAYSESTMNVTQKNISVVDNPDGSKTVHYVRNVTVALTPVSEESEDSKNGTALVDGDTVISNSSSSSTNLLANDSDHNKVEFFFHHSTLKGNSWANHETTDKPEVSQPVTNDLNVTRAVVTATEDASFSASTTTLTPANDGPSTLDPSPVDQDYSPQGKANGEPNPFIIPTAETSKGSLQVTYTPSVGWMPYPLCIYGPPNPPPQSVRQTSSGSITFPVTSPASSSSQVEQTLQYGQSLILPSTSNGQTFIHAPKFVQPIMQPSQQGIPYLQPGSAPFPPQRYGPSGPAMPYFPVNQGYHQPTATGQGRPFYCTYLPTPTFQFPVVPGVSEFQRAVPDSGSDVALSNKDTTELEKAYEQELKSRDYTAGCPPHTRACSDHSRCVEKSQWCDGEVDCADASDETRCSCRDRVDRERLCDGYFDCPLGEDELGCFGCDKNSFSCDDPMDRRRWGNCVELSQRCDGYSDCKNGKDELNCNIITQSVDEREMFTVGYTTGYLHRNWRGKWYPACTASETWATEACRDEIGDENYRGFPSVDTVVLQRNYNGPYVVESSPNEIRIVQSCSNKAVFVNCPRMPCGTRVSSLKVNSLFDVPYSDRFPPRGYHQESYDESGDYRSEDSKPTKGTNGKGIIRGILNIFDVSNTTDDTDPIVSASRVVGGRPSQPKAWPSLVAMNRDGIFHCGGVILDEIWVLTAAHCIDGFSQHYYDIQAGILRRFSYSPMEQSRKVTHVIVYPTYDKAVMKNDLALLRLESPLNFNRWVRPACLPEITTAGPSWRTGPTAATTCVSAGWGSLAEHGPDPDHLREVELPILPNCKYLVDQNEAEICAGTIQGGRDTCQGDSGGPLMCRNPNSPSQWYVAGIVSHGEGCARPNEPGAYTKVSRFVDWINRIRDQDELPMRKPLQRCPGYYCHSGSRRCYPSKRRCDKTVDCMDAEDEINCQRFTDFSLFKSSNTEEKSLSSENAAKTNNGKAVAESNAVTSFEEPSTTVESLSTATEVTTPQSTTMVQIVEETTIRPIEISTTVTTGATTAQTSTTVKLHENLTTVAPNEDIITPRLSPAQYFSCRILLQTIDLTKRCDRNVDCEDGTDEENCTCKDYLSKISPASICDGHIDCRDGTDEENCQICASDEFHCRRSRECVPMAKRCNIKGDCQFNEDELGCMSLTNGKYVITDIDGMPHHNPEGILTWYENGKYVPFCLDRRPNKPNVLAKQMCSYFGYVGCESFNKTRVENNPLQVLASSATNLIPYENASLHSSSTDDEPRCTGLYIRCLPTIHTVSLAYRLKAIDGDEDDTFLWPWHAAVFVDGGYKCSAVLLEPSWLLTSIHCTDDLDLNQNYTTALLGVSRSYLQVDGPHQQMSQVDEIKTVKNSDAVLLHLRHPANMTRHVQPMYLQKRTHAPAESDTCATVGVDNHGRSRTVFLKAVLDNCPDNHRCYKSVNSEKCENRTMSAWSGTVVCFGCGGWYPAAVYHEENGLCSFAKKRSFSSIDSINTNLITGMQEPLEPNMHEPNCNGYRCPSGKCIALKKVCDGVPDCRDGADEDEDYCREVEDHCVNGVHDTIGCHCSQSELRCKNGQCVPKSSFCDGKNDCADGSDEPSTCDCASYLKLTAPEKICDGRRHCFDKSDENPEVCLCKDSSFKCDRHDNVCVPDDFVCDGQSDCPTGEDESQCQTLRHHSYDPPGYGEVIERSYGVWHSRCFPSGASMSENELEPNLCTSLGYSYVKNITESDSSSQMNPPVVPKLDKFYVVRLNPRSWIIMRDDKAFVSLHPPLETCYRHYVTCA